jgi:hypothetical protein
MFAEVRELVWVGSRHSFQSQTLPSVNPRITLHIWRPREDLLLKTSGSGPPALAMVRDGDYAAKRGTLQVVRGV